MIDKQKEYEHLERLAESIAELNGLDFVLIVKGDMSMMSAKSLNQPNILGSIEVAKYQILREITK